MRFNSWVEKTDFQTRDGTPCTSGRDSEIREVPACLLLNPFFFFLVTVRYWCCAKLWATLGPDTDELGFSPSSNVPNGQHLCPHVMGERTGEESGAVLWPRAQSSEPHRVSQGSSLVKRTALASLPSRCYHSFIWPGNSCKTLRTVSGTGHFLSIPSFTD